MPSLRSRLVRLWMKRLLKPRFDGETTAEELRDIMDRVTRLSLMPRGVSTEDASIAGVPARWFIPRTHDAGHVLLYWHGGGYNFGSAANYRELAARLALSCRARVLVPDYRLAPEHPHPAAVEDAVTCYRRLLEQNVDVSRLAVAGDSAGGGLTLALLLKLKLDGVALPAAAVCLSPWVDLTCDSETYTERADVDPMMTPPVIRACAARYVGEHDPREPLISPLFGDPAGLPPLLIQAGSDEILLGDSQRLAEAAERVGVDVTLEVTPDMWHVWHLFARVLPEARPAIERIGEFIRSRWDATR